MHEAVPGEKLGCTPREAGGWNAEQTQGGDRVGRGEGVDPCKFSLIKPLGGPCRQMQGWELTDA